MNYKSDNSNPSTVLSGQWSGYDEKNNDIVSGKYSFKKLLSVEIIPQEEKHTKAIIELSNQQLGENYITEDILNNHSDNYICKVAINKETDTVCGFYIAYVIKKEEFSSKFGIPSKNIPLSIKHDENPGVFKTLAVKNEYKGYGIGTKLMDNCINNFSEKGIKTISTIAWEKNKDNFDKLETTRKIKAAKDKTKFIPNKLINLDGILIAKGFIKTITLLDYWYEESINDNYSCPVCDTPCRCSAILYTKSL